MPLKEYDQIRLKPKYQGTLGHQDKIAQDAHRTPGKDEVAQYIVENVIKEDRWPVNMTDLEDEVGYSRQHISNTILEYFEGIDEDRRQQIQQQESNTNDHQPQTTTTDTSTETAQIPDGTPKSIFVEIDGSFQEVRIDVPEDVDRSSYVRGFLDGKKS